MRCVTNRRLTGLAAYTHWEPLGRKQAGQGIVGCAELTKTPVEGINRRTQIHWDQLRKHGGIICTIPAISRREETPDGVRHILHPYKEPTYDKEQHGTHEQPNLPPSLHPSISPPSLYIYIHICKCYIYHIIEYIYIHIIITS